MPIVSVDKKHYTFEESIKNLPQLQTKAEQHAEESEMQKVKALKNKKAKSPTKKAIKKLLKEIESEVIPKKIKSKKVDKLLKEVEVKDKKDSTKKEIKN